MLSQKNIKNNKSKLTILIDVVIKKNFNKSEKM